MTTRAWVGTVLLLPLLLTSQAMAQQLVTPETCHGKLVYVPDAQGNPQLACAVTAAQAPAPSAELPEAADAREFRDTAAPTPSEEHETAQPSDSVTPTPPPSSSAEVLPMGSSHHEQALQRRDESMSSRRSAQGVPKRWYGAPIVSIDGTAALVMGLGADAQEVWPVFVGYSAYLLGGPTVHAAHGRWGIGAASLGLRATLPGLGILIGNAAGGGNDDSAPITGMVLGILTAATLDSAVFAREPVPQPKTGFQWSPNVAVGKDSAEVAVSGTF